LNHLGGRHNLAHMRSALLALGLLLALAAASCLEVPRPKEAEGPVALDLRLPAGAKLEAACSPTGVEICFNARDDNCNGVIDEGCGLRTGILQFTIAWDEASADVDLNVTDPAGELARVGEPTDAGLVKDRDCPRASGECQGQNIENVYLAEGEPRRGLYRVVVRLDKLNGAAAPIRTRLGVRVGQRASSMELVLSPGPGTEEKTLEFRL
jgi:tRNA (guanosine-2'-O-)-methyltransferase